MTPTSPVPKRRQVLGFAALVLIAGAIVAGVLGTRSKSQATNRLEPEAIKVQAEPDFKGVLDSLLTTPDADATASEVAAVAPSTPELQKPLSSSAPIGVTADGASNAKNEGLLASTQGAATGAMVQQQQQAAKTIVALAIASTGAFCYPEDADALHLAVDNHACSIIVLNNPVYELHSPLVISRPLVIAGNPVLLPSLDGYKTERIFHVVAGGYLEVRYLRLQQGVGRKIPNPVRIIHLRVGTIALVELGGRLTVTGCTLETREQTIAAFIKELEDNLTTQRLSFGGYIAVLGGTVDVSGCVIWRNRPLGNPNFFEINVGRDVLVLAGTARITGVFYTSIQLFHNKNSAGGIFCVLGGNLIITGLALNTITGANSQFGTGLQTYVGGGNAILTGTSRFTASVVLSRGGFGLFSVSAGNLVITGYVQMSVRGVSADFGTATFSVGTGTLTSIGTALSSVHIARTMHIAGGYYFNGAGVITLVGSVRTNQGTSTNQMGIGLHICNVAGVTQVIYASSYTCAMARSQFAYGTDTFMAAGFLTYVRVFRYRNIGAGVFIGNGNQVYVGAGAFVGIRNRQAARILIDWRTTRNVYTIAGTQTGRAGANTNIFMSSAGRYPLGNLTFGSGNGTKGSKRELSHLPMFRVLQEENANPNDGVLFPRSFMLLVDDKAYETKLVVPKADDIDAARKDGEILSLAFFRAAEKLAPLDFSKNVLQVYTNNTDCLACGVDGGRLLGDTPCVGSNQCFGKTLPQILSLAETPSGLKEAAAQLGWGELSNSGASNDAASVRRNARALADAEQAQANGPNPDVWVVEGELFVYCDRSPDANGTSTCGHDYRTVRAALAYTLGDAAGAAKDFSVSAWDKNVAIKPELSAYLLQGDLDLGLVHESLQAPAHDKYPESNWSTYGYTVTVIDETKRAAVSKAVADLIEDASELMANIDFLDGSSTTYQDVTLTRTNTVVVPGLPKGISAEQLLAGSIAPSVVVMGSTDSYNSLSALAVKQTYSISIANFPRGQAVKVELWRKVLGTASDVELVAAQPSITVPLVSLKPVTTQEWTVPDLPVDGHTQYFLQASLAAIKAYKDSTPLFKLTN